MSVLILERKAAPSRVPFARLGQDADIVAVAPAVPLDLRLAVLLRRRGAGNAGAGAQRAEVDGALEFRLGPLQLQPGGDGQPVGGIVGHDGLMLMERRFDFCV
jgi:hypothetical protein